MPSVPLGRVGGANEVAKTVMWLLSEDSSYISGSIVPVTGGR
jgi:glucose 1-dehydrogenase